MCGAAGDPGAAGGPGRAERQRPSAHRQRAPQADGGEREFDRICGPQVDTVLGWEVEERQQFLLIVRELLRS